MHSSSHLILNALIIVFSILSISLSFQMRERMIECWKEEQCVFVCILKLMGRDIIVQTCPRFLCILV